jgi:hypothetical protein
LGEQGFGSLTRRIFRNLAGTAPELDCAIIGELSRLLSSCVLILTNKVNPARNAPMQC